MIPCLAIPPCSPGPPSGFPSLPFPFLFTYSLFLSTSPPFPSLPFPFLLQASSLSLPSRRRKRSTQFGTVAGRYPSEIRGTHGGVSVSMHNRCSQICSHTTPLSVKNWFVVTSASICCLASFFLLIPLASGDGAGEGGFVHGELPAVSIQRFLQDLSHTFNPKLCIIWGPLPG